MSLSLAGRQRRRGAPGSPAGRATGAGIASLVALTACAALISAATPAQAASVLGTGPFGLIPSPLPGGQPRSYFQFSVAPGRSAQDTAVISNESSKTERLRIIMSRGVTAANSGSAYESVTGRCDRSTCWASGLPRTVTLAPGARRALSFRVAVPRGTRPGQYLAGITAESALRRRAVRLGSHGHASARAIIIDQVTVGVAVTVGSLARLRTGVRISAVSAGWIGTMPRMSIPVRNTGQTFVRATGSLACSQNGRRHSYPVIMETVLPGGRAVLAVNARGLQAGSLPCSVRLRDTDGALFSWSGAVNLPNRKATRTLNTAKGVYVSLPEDSVPPWAIALMVIGALIFASLMILLLRRRRSPRPALEANGKRAARNRPAT